MASAFTALWSARRCLRAAARNGMIRALPASAEEQDARHRGQQQGHAQVAASPTWVVLQPLLEAGWFPLENPGVERANYVLINSSGQLATHLSVIRLTD
ncbi:hypothetical protein ACWGQL_33435 [Streptomyces lydicus]